MLTLNFKSFEEAFPSEGEDIVVLKRRALYGGQTFDFVYASADIQWQAYHADDGYPTGHFYAEKPDWDEDDDYTWEKVCLINGETAEKTDHWISQEDVLDLMFPESEVTVCTP